MNSPTEGQDSEYLEGYESEQTSINEYHLASNLLAAKLNHGAEAC